MNGKKILTPIILGAIAIGIVMAIVRLKTEIAVPPSPTSTEFPQDQNGNFALYVSNQSFAIDPVDVKIYIDDKQAVNQDFYVGTQHTYVSFRFLLSKGGHNIKIESQKGDATFEENFDIIDKHMGVIHYDYNPEGSGPEYIKHPYFTFRFGKDKPLEID